MDSNTVVFFLGDQGGKRPNSPLRGTKKGGQALYEGGARIPFIVRWPGVVQPGSVSATVVTTNDVFPTMLEMAGGRPADYPKLDGASLVPALQGKGAPDRSEVFLYRSYEDQYAAVRSGRWKLIACRSGRCELFDLEADLSEVTDLSSKLPDRVNTLKTALRDWEKKMDVPGEKKR
jgi:arylsulfatase A-like enzyme